MELIPASRQSSSEAARRVSDGLRSPIRERPLACSAGRHDRLRSAPRLSRNTVRCGCSEIATVLPHRDFRIAEMPLDQARISGRSGVHGASNRHPVQRPRHRINRLIVRQNGYSTWSESTWTSVRPSMLQCPRTTFANALQGSDILSGRHFQRHTGGRVADEVLESGWTESLDRIESSSG